MVPGAQARACRATNALASRPYRPVPPCTAVCTLADLSYDIYHATIDINEADGTAQQEFYIRWACFACCAVQAADSKRQAAKSSSRQRGRVADEAAWSAGRPVGWPWCGSRVKPGMRETGPRQHCCWAACGWLAPHVHPMLRDPSS